MPGGPFTLCDLHRIERALASVSLGDVVRMQNNESVRRKRGAPNPLVAASLFLVGAAFFSACAPPRPTPTEPSGSKSESAPGSGAANPNEAPGSGSGSETLAPKPASGTSTDAAQSSRDTSASSAEVNPGAQPTGDAGAAAPLPVPGSLAAVTDEQLCITQGNVARTPGKRLFIATPKVRAVVRDSTGDSARLRFTYRGPTEEVALLASGAVRRQLGLKLRAADTCNLITVMWRVVPREEVVVSLKRNRGLHTHAECGAEGFVTVPATSAAAPPALMPGASHSLEAELVGRSLVVSIDGAPVWRGDLGPEILDLAGWTGFQTDNVSLEAELYSTGQPLPGGAKSPCPEPEI